MALSRTTLTTTETHSASSSTTASVTLAAGDLLVVIVGTSIFPGANVVTGITWNGNALTKAVSVNGTGTYSIWSETGIWYYKVASGASATVIITCGGSNDVIHSTCLKYTGHDTTTPIGDTDSTFAENESSVEPSLTLTTASGDEVVDALQLEDTSGVPTVGAGQTSLHIESSTNGWACGHSVEAATGASVTMSWTRAFNRGYDFCAAVIKVAGGVTTNLSLPATGVGAAKTVRQAGLPRATTARGTAGVTRLASLVLPATSRGAAAMTLLRVIMMSLAATGKAVASVTRLGSLIKAATGTAAPVVTRLASLSQAAAGKASPLVGRLGFLTQAAMGVGVAAMTMLRVILLSLVATGRGVATITRTATVALAATGTATALAVRLAVLSLAATARGSPGVTRLASLTLLATATATAAMAMTSVSTIAAAATGVGVAAMSMVVFKLLGTGGAGTAAVAMTATIAEIIVSRLTGHAGLGIYLKAKTRWSKRRRNWKPRGV